MALPRFRRTKIIATIGPSTDSDEMLQKLIAAGADVIRLNMAHAKHEWVRAVMKRIRRASEIVGKEVAVMMDIKGPEIRTGDVAAPIELKVGEVFDFIAKPYGETLERDIPSVSVNYANIVNDVKVGDTVLVDSGLIRLEVLEKNQFRLRCRVMVPGSLTSRRHINLPGVRVSLPSFTEKDKSDTEVGIEEGIDFVALSFVREARDIETLAEFLHNNNSKARIIAKIEDQEAITNLDEIIRIAHGLMVARGDLGIECPFEELPIIQRRAVMTCLKHTRPVIVATHMLESMIDNPVPTRAEITDIANAVFEQADCIMLSGETATGQYPLDCVGVFDKVARRMEEIPGAGFAEAADLPSDKFHVLKSAVHLADQLPAAGMVVCCRHGAVAHTLAALRPKHSPIFAFTPTKEKQRHLCLLRGVEPFCVPFSDSHEETLSSALAMLRARNRVSSGDKLVIIGDAIAGDRQIVDTVQLRTID